VMLKISIFLRFVHVCGVNTGKCPIQTCEDRSYHVRIVAISVKLVRSRVNVTA
jgi:hypothetical protein